MAPSNVKAVVIKALKNPSVETIPTPKLRDDYILIKNHAVALNPTDWKHADGGFGHDPTGAIIGCDYVGTVEEVGSKVTKSFQKGDRVTGFVHGSNMSQHQDGAFAEYIVAKGDLQIKVPDQLSDEGAATLGLGIVTVAQGLYQALKLALPNKPLQTPEPILIYGGSSATGILGIQFAKASGYKVYTTSSPKNFEYLKSLGADETFDYNSSSCAKDIKAAASGKLKLAWDCIAEKDTGKICAEALSDEGGEYASLLPVKDEVIKGVNSKIGNKNTLAYTVFGEEFEKYMKFQANKEDYEFGKKFMEIARELLESGKVKPARPTVNRDGKGLEGVLVGLKELKEGKVSGEKLVYKL